MTREEQIEEQLWYIASHPNCPEHTASKSVGVNYFNLGFRYGALWADQNPQSPWISVKERLPEEGQKIVAHYVTAYRELDKVVNYPNNVMIDGSKGKLVRWFPYPDLPKEK